MIFADMKSGLNGHTMAKKAGGLLTCLLARPKNWRSSRSSLEVEAPGKSAAASSQNAARAHPGCANYHGPSSTTSNGSHHVSSGSVPRQQDFEVVLGYSSGMDKHYYMLEEIGRGGNGLVKQVKHRETGREYACKTIRKVLGPEFSEQKRASHLESLKREVTVLQKLKGCLNVVELQAVYEDQDNVYIIMEQCKGGELWHRIGDRHYSERTVASYMRGILRTLAVMHSHHILHRDIKPGNFMLLTDRDDSPLKAIDFGLAMPFEPSELPITNLGTEGTPWFMAPEVLASQVTPASDVWAAGIMAHQLLTGRFPFDDKKNPSRPAMSAIWKSVLTDKLYLNRACWSGISDEAKSFVTLLLERDPTKRPTAKQALEHPFLRGDRKERSLGTRLNRSVVQRIQRFAQGGAFKRTVLQAIAAELLVPSGPLPQTEASPTLSYEGEDSDDDDLADANQRVDMTASGSFRPVVATPHANCLEVMYKHLDMHDGQDSVETSQLAARLRTMGFRLEESEVPRLLEQVDRMAASGRIRKAAFAASQVDWRELQQQHSGQWRRLARRTFGTLDADRDGILTASDIADALHSGLTEDDDEPYHEAVREAMREAGRASTEDQVIDFDDFLNMLKVGSLDSLDMYDDRMGSSGQLSMLGGSVDRINALLHRSSSFEEASQDSSTQGLYSKRAGGLTVAQASAAVAALTKADAVGSTELVQPTWMESIPDGAELLAKEGATVALPAVAFKFDVGRADGPAKTEPPAKESAGVARPAAFKFDLDRGLERPRTVPLSKESAGVARPAAFKFDAGRTEGSANTDKLDKEGAAVARPSAFKFDLYGGVGIAGADPLAKEIVAADRLAAAFKLDLHRAAGTSTAQLDKGGAAVASPTVFKFDLHCPGDNLKKSWPGKATDGEELRALATKLEPGQYKGGSGAGSHDQRSHGSTLYKNAMLWACAGKSKV